MHTRHWLLLFVCAGAMSCGGSAFDAALAGNDGSVDGSQAQTSALDGEASGPETAPLGAEAASPTDARATLDDALADVGPDVPLVDGTAPDAADRGDVDADVAMDAANAASPDGDLTHDGSIDTGLADSAPVDASRIGDSAEAQEACVPLVYYLDGDGDRFGGTTTSTGCAPPDGGAWVLQGGDCDDSNAEVNPGQTGYFAQGYVPTGKTTTSFDYDCNGQETESGASAKAACALSGLSCVGSGYLEASLVRSGPGVDTFCGSSQTVVCSEQVLSCVAGSPQSASPITCK